ncbi:TetR/AcrR family transcriptional regulator [Spirochaeta isovalerica]|uniref:AcrR family transcriptional regulator n=1 Tax=Spirochaeta isovalerica TaxID=150 RepID=A0A841RFS3_9SPIO|nr:TetR/AcrR family transcriptional regulator [Spirochaeta isovalerica]MBB6482067.1 AcrR family transcriptional regulator [Spirochaeta isovalerica]
MNSTFLNLPDEKQKRVIEASIVEFTEWGYRDASTNRIVRNLKIAKGSLFKYFGGKNDLYYFLIKLSTDELLSFIESEKKQEYDNWVEAVEAYASIEFDFLILHPLYYHFLKRIADEINLDELIPIKDHLTAKSQKIFHSILAPYYLSELKQKHIAYLIQGYNRDFLLENKCNYNSELKEKYMGNLRAHLNLIGD